SGALDSAQSSGAGIVEKPRAGEEQDRIQQAPGKGRFAQRPVGHVDERLRDVWLLGTVYMDSELSLSAGIARRARPEPGHHNDIHFGPVRWEVAGLRVVRLFRRPLWPPQTLFFVPANRSSIGPAVWNHSNGDGIADSGSIDCVFRDWSFF